MFHILFIRSSVGGHLGCFCPLFVVDNAARGMGVQISLQVPAFSSLGHIHRSGIAGSCGNSMLNFLRTAILFFVSDFKKKKKLLFIYLAASGLSCRTRDLCCGMRGLSLRRAGFSLVVARGLQSARLSSCGARA